MPRKNRFIKISDMSQYMGDDFLAISKMIFGSLTPDIYPKY